LLLRLSDDVDDHLCYKSHGKSNAASRSTELGQSKDDLTSDLKTSQVAGLDSSPFLARTARSLEVLEGPIVEEGHGNCYTKVSSVLGYSVANQLSFPVLACRLDVNVLRITLLAGGNYPRLRSD